MNRDEAKLAQIDDIWQLRLQSYQLKMLKLQNSSFFRFGKTTAFLSGRKVDFFCFFFFFFGRKAQNSDILHSPLYAGPGTIIPDYGSWLDIDKSKMILLCLEETSIFLLIRLAASKVIEKRHLVLCFIEK